MKVADLEQRPSVQLGRQMSKRHGATHDFEPMRLDLDGVDAGADDRSRHPGRAGEELTTRQHLLRCGLAIDEECRWSAELAMRECDLARSNRVTCITGLATSA